MPTPRMGVLAGLVSQWTDEAFSTDCELIDRYFRNRDEGAFTAIVRRHGRSVLGVCRRILGNSTDADDAFQATFLVLAKKAHHVRFHENISAWLLSVAVRAGRELLRQRTRRAAREMPGPVPEPAMLTRFDFESNRIMLEEVANLSAPYSSAVMLCELDGVPRSEAARRLGIPEGTLSSRLAAARKILAARLTARGVSLAVLAPLTVTVPPALARSIVSDLPSHNALELMEVLMRSSSGLVAGKYLATILLLALVAGGWSLGDEPKAQPLKPVSARVVEETDVSSRLILAFREDVRYLDPDGREIDRIDIAMAKKADPNLITGTLTIGSEGIKLSRFLPICGRPGPGGILPIESNGLKILATGSPPKLSAPRDHVDTEGVAGWSPDGQSLYISTVERSAIWGATGYATHRVAISSGERKALSFGSEHELIDVSADGRSFLTKRHRTRAFGLPGFYDEYELCVLSAAGDVQRKQAGRTNRFDFTDHRLSPDGRRTVEVAKPKNDGNARAVYSVSVHPQPNEIATNFTYYRPDGTDFECRAVAWSPDGERIVSVWTPYSWQDKLTWHVVVTENGGTLKKVSTIETPGDEQLRSLDWR